MIVKFNHRVRMTSDSVTTLNCWHDNTLHDSFYSLWNTCSKIIFKSQYVVTLMPLLQKYFYMIHYPLKPCIDINLLVPNQYGNCCTYECYSQMHFRFFGSRHMGNCLYPSDTFSKAVYYFWSGSIFEPVYYFWKQYTVPSLLILKGVL